MSFALFAGLPVLCECVCAVVSLHFYSCICVFNYVYSFSCAKYCVCILHFAVVVELNMLLKQYLFVYYCFMNYFSVSIT